MLGKRSNKVYDPFLKAGLGYQNPERLKKAIAAQPKMYDGERLHNTKLIIDSQDSEETLKDAEESKLKMKNKMIQLNYAKLNALYETFISQKEFSAEQTYFQLLLLLMYLLKQKHESLMLEKEKISSDFKDIQANLLKRIKILENDFKRSQAQSIDFKLKLQHQKEKMACDNSWKSKLTKLSNENNKLKTIKKGKNVITKFEKYETLGKLLYVTPLNTNTGVKAKKVSNFEVKADSRVKRALFTSLIVAKSRNLGATFVVAKSRFSVAKTPTTTNKVSSASSLSPDSSQSRTLS
ncbi:hypothetical protein Tco_1332436, partial [Tanacetum coccineum]